MKILVFLCAALWLSEVNAERRIRNQQRRASQLPVSLTTLCPELTNSPNINSYRYDNTTRKCYLGGQKGPCGQNMIFYAQGEINGTCDCKSSDRILVFHRKTKQCYFIFQRGYCKKTQWLDLNRQGKPKCTANPCSSSTSTKEMVRFNGKCVELNKSHKDCLPDQVIGFEPRTRLPRCVFPSGGGSGSIATFAVGVPASPCSVGTVAAIAGICQPPFDFD